MGRNFCCLVAALVFVHSALSLGQDAVVEELYGRGVHAFYSQNYLEAYNALNTAVASGSRDPRVYYYRALALQKFGRPDEASFDIYRAVELENAAGQPYSVGRALERIQGAERVALEAQRRAARLALYGRQKTEERVRYEEIKRAEGAALRGGGAAPPARLPTPTAPDATDPFPPRAAPLPMPAPPATPPLEATPAPPPAARPVVPPAEAPETPVPPVPAAPAADPFAAPPATPAAPPPPRPAAPAADPFGEPPAAPPAATPPPAAPAPAPAAADPFGPPTTPAPAAPATPPPAAPANDDPFAAPPAPPAAPTPPAAPAPPATP